MGHNWQEVRLGDVVDLLTGHPFKSAFYSSDENDPRLVGGDNIVQGSLRWDKVRRWPTQYTNGLEQYWLSAGDVVLAMDRPWIEAGLKRAVMGPNDLPALLVQRTARLRGSDRLDISFLRYVIASAEFTQYVLSVQTGTAVPHISPTQIRDFRFQLPPLSQQRAIADTLKTLDDKIELNRKMNETLEQMARAIFKSWFIDFDPVHAKRQGKKPFGMDDATADLFPDSFEQSELGEIPRGWQPKLLGEICRLEYGKNLPTKELHPSGVPVFGAGGIIGYYNDVLFRDPVILITCRGNGCGTIHETFSESFVTNNSIALIPFEKKMSRHFIKYAMLGIDRSVIITGSAQPQITVTHLQTLKLLLPDTPDLWSVFHSIIEPWWQLIRQNAKESDVLAATRDLLLPRLLSGELTLKEATA